MTKLTNIKHETIAQCVASGMGFDAAVAKALPSASPGRRQIWVSLLEQGEYHSIQARIAELSNASQVSNPVEEKETKQKPSTAKKTVTKAKVK